MRPLLAFLTPKKVTQFISDKSTVRQALEKFEAHKFNVVPIVDEFGKYVGTISQGDILKLFKEIDDFNLEASEGIKIMDIERYRSYSPLRIDAEMMEVFTLSLEQNFVPIVDDSDTYIGIIKRSDIIKYLYKKMLPYLDSED